MDEAVATHFREWVKADIWAGTSSIQFHRALKRVYDATGVMWLPSDDFEEGIQTLVDELHPDSDQESVARIIAECSEKIQVLNAFFDANDVYGLESP